jgi:mono/diheme cytochrome c family protein
MGAGALLVGMLTVSACDDPPKAVPDRASREAALRAAVGPQWDQPVPGLATADLAQGADIYGKSCGPCHGVGLDGRGPRSAGLDPPAPPLVGDGAGALPPAAELHLIRHGSPGTAMAPFGRGLTDEQLVAVLAYIHDRRAAAAPPGGAPAIRPPR